MNKLLKRAALVLPPVRKRHEYLLEMRAALDRAEVEALTLKEIVDRLQSEIDQKSQSEAANFVLGIDRAVEQSSTESWFRARLNGIEMWLPRYTITTMRHCLHSSPAGPLNLFVETAHWNLMRDKIGPGSLFLDIGAATGAMSIPFAMLGARVVAFEPSPRARHYLTETAVRNEISFAIHPFALSDQVGELDFMEFPEDPTGVTPYLPEGSRLVVGSEAIYPAAVAHRVQVKTLDSVEIDLGIDESLSLVVKIDVEGFEVNVLKGSRVVIEKYRPLFFIDIHQYPGDRSRRTDGEVREFLSSFNYSFEDNEHVLICWPH